MAIIESNKITKKYIKTSYDIRRPFRVEREEKVAVSGFDLEIEKGEFVGFLGSNGAGKTTFLKILSGIMHPTSGTAKVMGYTPWERDYRYLRQMAIVMGQKNQLWWDLPAIDSYNLLQAIYDIPDSRYKKNLEMMMEVLDMKDLLGKRLRNMSLGERMKCELAASFLHDPKVVFLDEPTIGLDVVSSRSIRKFLKMMNEEQKCTFILTSHYIGDIEELCKRVLIITKGEKVYDGTLLKLKERYAPNKRIEVFLQNLEDKKTFAHLSVKEKKIEENKGIIYADKSALGEITKEVFSKFSLENILISDADTEEIIRKIFGQK
ncbi:MAG: ATP-binding cassette domain-containing protein [Candidatus Berkelbacteria bacterium]|nr:ATP-binding cassette domain-containing protein [Candidatus Berkelbacteria bacterium]